LTCPPKFFPDGFVADAWRTQDQQPVTSKPLVASSVQARSVVADHVNTFPDLWGQQFAVFAGQLIDVYLVTNDPQSPAPVGYNRHTDRVHNFADGRLARNVEGNHLNVLL
jgi:hypothetical protein